MPNGIELQTIFDLQTNLKALSQHSNTKIPQRITQERSSLKYPTLNHIYIMLGLCPDFLPLSYTLYYCLTLTDQPGMCSSPTWLQM